MKKKVTFLLVLFSFLALDAQENLIRNGGFENGLTDSTKIKYLDDWHMDKENPSSGWWGDPGLRFAGLTSGDSATLYQVVEIISADTVLYDLQFMAKDSWNTGKVVVIASTSDADTATRAIYQTDTLDFAAGGTEFELLEFRFGFSENSAYVGKHLIIEFTSTSADAGDSWTHFDDVVMEIRLPGENSPPVANAGPDQKVTGGDLVILDGSGSSDADEDPLTYKWVSQYPGITLSDPGAEKPTFTAPDVVELSTFNFSLFVNDGTVNSDTVKTSVTVIPAGELIRNGDFSLRAPDWATTSNLKDVFYWNIDKPREELAGGLWSANYVDLTSKDPNFYQVVDEIGTEAVTYSLTISAKTSWYAKSINSIFSVSDADSSVRTQISLQENIFDIDPANDVTSTDWITFKHVASIPENSSHDGMKLILEFEIISYDYEDEIDNGWVQVKFVSLVKEVTSDIESSNIKSLNIYPNPASRVLIIESDAPVSKVNVYSLTGSLVKSVIRQDVNRINVNDLHSGLYIVTLTTEKGVVNKKLHIK